MKKSAIVALAAAAAAMLCIPAFSGCSAQVGYKLKTDDNGNKYYSVAAEGFTSFLKGEVVIPETYNGYPVKEIEDQAFSGTSITKVTIPASVEVIGTAAFAYNSSLKEVVFAEDSTLEEISWGSFAYCLNMKSFTVPSSVKTVDGLAFYGCESLREINFSAGLERINIGAFTDCVALSSVTLHEGLISIGNSAFYNCASLESIVLPNGMHDTEQPLLDENGNQISDENGNPGTVVIPAVGAIAFFGCTNLDTVVLGEGITTISEGLFVSCTSLETLYLPSTLTQIKGVYKSGSDVYGHAFFNVPKLKNVYFAGTEEQWEEVKANTDNIPYEKVSDNSAILNITPTFNTSYKG